MRKLLALVVVLLSLQAGLATEVRAQRIELRKLGLMRPDFERNLRAYAGDSQEQVRAALGNPTRTGTHWSEIDEKTIEEWYYGASVLYFLDGVLDDYALNDRSLLVGESFATSFGVGSVMGTRTLPSSPRLPDRERIIDYFYGYNITKTPGTSRNIPFHIISSNWLMMDGVNLDSHFQVLFNSGKRITNIFLGD